MGRVTGIASTHYQVSQPRPDAKPADRADSSAPQPAVRSTEEHRSQGYRNADQTAENTSPGRVSPRELGKMIQEMNSRLQNLTSGSHDVDLVYEDEVQEVVIQVKERESGDLISQWPTEEMVSMRAAFRQMIGMIVDQRS